MRKLTLLLGFGSALLSSCVSVQVADLNACTTAGKLIAGGFCAHTNYDETTDITTDQIIDMLEAQPERPDPANPGQKLPARAGAVFMSADDFNALLTSMSQLCRAMGNDCSYEEKQKIERLESFKRQHLESL